MNRDVGRKSTDEKSKHDTQVADVADPSKSRIATVYLLALQLLAFSVVVTSFVTLIIIYGAQYGAVYPLPPAMKEFFITSVIITVLLASAAWAMKSHLNRQRQLFTAAIRQQPLKTEQGAMLRQQQLGYVIEADRELREFKDWSADGQVHNLGDLVNYPIDDDEDDDDE